MMKYKNIPIFVAHKGCPNNCIFCNQKKISGAKDEMNEENLRNLLSQSVNNAEGCNTQIAFFGGSFTGIDRNIMEKYLSVAEEYVIKYNLDGIRLSTRPDYINDEILNILKHYGVKTIELGVQSMSNKVLKLNERNMTVSQIKDACSLIKEYEFELGVQLMTSMYGSDFETDIYSARQSVFLRPDFVRIYPTVVIPETKLCELYDSGKYKIRTLEETVEVCAEMLDIFETDNIEVIRMGLMTNEDINCEKVIGAYHPAFGELVFAARNYKILSEMLRGKETENKVLTISCLPQLTSKICGHKKENIIKLKRKYGFREIKFRYTENENTEIEIN